jgi:hypothetical protein
MSRVGSPAALAYLCALCVTACSGSGSDSESESVGATPTSNGSTTEATSGSTESTIGTESTTATTTSTDPTDPTTSTTSTTSAETTTGEETTTGGVDPCADTPTFEDGKTPRTVLHVAKDGVDGPECGPEESPCATISSAAAKLSPGAALRLHAGTYGGDNYLSDLSGTAEAPIWIGGAPDEARPVLEGGGEGLHLTRVRYVVVHDVEVRGASQNGINVDDGGAYDDPEATRHLILRDLHVHDIGQGGNQDCVKLSGVDDYIVRDSEIDHCGEGGSGIDHVGCHAGLILGNQIHDLGNGVQAKGGSVNIEIRGNRIDRTISRALNMGGSTGFEFFRPPLTMDGVNAEARDIRAIANVMVKTQAPLAFVGCVDCLAANNTLIDPQQWILRILQETVSTPDYEFAPSSGGIVRQNLVLFARGDLSTYVNIGSNTAPETFSFARNLWYASDDPGLSSPAADLPTVEDDPIVGVAPQLVDPQGDYHLSAGSPAVGTGLVDPSVLVDFDGACYDDPPSRGAYEFKG